MKGHVYILAATLVGLALVLASASLVGVTMASPAVGVQPSLLARGAYEDFKVKSVKGSPVEFDVKAKSVVDVVVRKHDYAIGSHTGWHSHPGPVFITVTEGRLTYYLYDDPTCTPHVVEAGSGFVDDGRGHMVRNESGELAQDVSVIIAPPSPPGPPNNFRGELDAPNPNCGF